MKSKFQEMIDKYPEIGGYSCMSSCPDGWVDIVELFFEYAMSVKISNACKYWELREPNEKDQSFERYPEPVIDIVIDQIKEKFGELCIYFHVTSIDSLPDKFVPIDGMDIRNDIRNQLSGFVDCLMKLAERTCEITGDPGAPHRRYGWLKILSPEKAKELDYELVEALDRNEP